MQTTKSRNPIKARVPALYALLATTALAAAPTVACSVQASSAPHDAALGKVEAALSTVGSDGATYSIPTTAALVIQGPAGVTCSPIASTPTEALSFPVGSYAVYLSASGCTSSVPVADSGTDEAGADTDASVPFTLDRTDATGTSTVSASLANPVQGVSVTDGGTSSLVFQFTLEQLGTLTMSTGNVDVSITTDASAGGSSPTQGTVLAPFTSTSISSADPGLISLLAVTGASGSVDLSMEELSEFTPDADGQACATFTPVFSTSITTASFTDLFEELGAPGAVGALCFNDATAPSSPTGITITIQRSGIPVTPAFQNALGTDAGAAGDGGADDGGAPSATFVAYYVVDSLTPPAYNGSTLSLAPFATPQTLNGGSTILINPLEGGGAVGTVVLGLSTLSLSLAP